MQNLHGFYVSMFFGKGGVKKKISACAKAGGERGQCLGHAGGQVAAGNRMVRLRCGSQSKDGDCS